MRNLALAMLAFTVFLAACGQANNTPLEKGGSVLTGVELKPRTDPSDTCNDGNVCTTDRYNPNSLLCEHEMIDNCCTTDAMCDADEQCASNNRCVPLSCDDGNVCTADSAAGNECVNTPIAGCCTTDAECATGQYCKDSSNTCVATPSCGDSNACTTDAFDMETETCTHDEIAGCCTTDAECGDGQYCKDSTHMCVGIPSCADTNVCTTDAFNATTEACTHTAIPRCCTADTQCFAARTTSWGYSAPCQVNTDCGTGQVCVGGSMCLPAAYDFGCTVDPTDSPELFENGVATVGGTCEMCADSNANGECSMVESFCSGGLDEDGDGLVDCADPDCTGSVECGGVECETTADCDTRETCTAGACVVIPEGNLAGDCSDNVDNDGDGQMDCADPGCASASVCQSAGQCTTTADCGTGQLCVSGTCRLYVGTYKFTWYNNQDDLPPANTQTLELRVECKLGGRDGSVVHSLNTVRASGPRNVTTLSFTSTESVDWCTPQVFAKDANGSVIATWYGTQTVNFAAVEHGRMEFVAGAVTVPKLGILDNNLGGYNWYTAPGTDLDGDGKPDATDPCPADRSDACVAAQN